MRVRPPLVVTVLLVSGAGLLGSAVRGMAALDATVKVLPAAVHLQAVSDRDPDGLEFRGLRCPHTHTHGRVAVGPEL